MGDKNHSGKQLPSAPAANTNPDTAAAPVVAPVVAKRGPRSMADLTAGLSEAEKAQIEATNKILADARKRQIEAEAAKGATEAKAKVLEFLNNPTTTSQEIVAMGNKVAQLLGYRDGTKTKPGAKVGESRRKKNQ